MERKSQLAKALYEYLLKTKITHKTFYFFCFVKAYYLFGKSILPFHKKHTTSLEKAWEHSLELSYTDIKTALKRRLNTVLIPFI